MRLIVCALLACLLMIVPHPAAAQAPVPTLRDLAETQQYSAGSPRFVRPTPDGDAVLFLRSGPRDRNNALFSFDTVTHKTRLLLTADALLNGKTPKVSAAEQARRERQRQTGHGITSYAFSEDGRLLLVPLGGKLFVVRRKDGKVTPLNGKAWLDAKLSPSAQYVAATDGTEVFVCPITGGKWTQLTKGGSEKITHGVSEFVAQEELDRPDGFWWSPDSTSILYQETDTRPVQTLFIPDPMHPENAPAAFSYPRAGTPNALVRLGIVPVSGGKTTWVKWDNKAFPYLGRVVWKEQAAPLTLVVLTRRQKELRVLDVDARTGLTHELMREDDPAWLNLDTDTRIPRWLPDGSGFLWSTERYGEWRLTLYGRDGTLRRVLTPMNFHYDGVADLDADTGSVVVVGSVDSRERHLFRVPLTGSVPVQITHGRGLHSASFSDNHAVYADTFSGLDGTHTVAVRQADGTQIALLPSVSETPPALPRIELTQVTAGTRTFDAVLVRPRAFDPAKKYPVLLSVYAGPTVKEVQAAARFYFTEQWLADAGYVVVSLDGRGTPGHGRAWERAIAGNLIDTALQDQCDALAALGAQYPEMDLTRVGVYGWSFGGYFSAMATLRRPDVFSCGIAGAPVTDWREYDTCYTERYMGQPAENPSGYAKASTLTYAKDLQRPLLLIHGVTDDNVYFVNTLKLCEALFEAGKSFELLPLTGAHMAGAENPAQDIALSTRQRDFFNSYLHPDKTP